jgi:hypothetical protein
MSQLHAINHEQGLYVLKCGEGFTCCGFEYAASQAKKVNDWLPVGMNIPETLKGILGTAEAYEYYAETMKIGAAYSAKTGKRCEADLIPQFIGHEGKRVEVTYKDGTTAKFKIGKSTGWFPIHLEIHPRQGGGDSVMPFESFKFLKR